MARFNRSVHNYPVKYTSGRHFSNTKRSIDDLVIFYYGWADISASGIKRKTQIKDKVSDEEKNRGIHRHAEDVIFAQYRKDQQPLCGNLKEIVDGIYGVQKNPPVKEKILMPIEQPSKNEITEESAMSSEDTVIVKSKLIQPPSRTVE